MRYGLVRIKEGSSEPSQPNIQLRFWSMSMDNLERRLVELNAALLKMTKGEPVDKKIIDQAQYVVAGGIPPVDTGSRKRHCYY